MLRPPHFVQSQTGFQWSETRGIQAPALVSDFNSDGIEKAFHGDNDGLVVAEVELESEDQQFKKPDFISEEVTGQEKYYNMMLLKNPFTTWKK